MSVATDSLTIFPLHSVLFPFGRMQLRIFEARYMDLIAHCMQEQTCFGICLIEEGQEVGTAALPHRVGVEARIVDFDMEQPGVLGITVRGMRRFRIVSQAIDVQQRVVAAVEWLDEPTPAPVSQDHADVLPLLRAIAADPGQKIIAAPLQFEDASWVGYRYAEVLPIPPLARQRLLELDDAGLRLSIIHEYLLSHGLLKAA